MKKNIYVVMPFTKTPSRDSTDLDIFFSTVLKETLENFSVGETKFNVRRSSHEFNINESMIQNIAECDYLVADLSGKKGNPNVTYEIGLRLALSDNPIILIRENHLENQEIFDLGHLHIYGYNPSNLDVLIDFLKSKILLYENELEVYRSPVLDALSTGTPSIYRASMVVARRKIDLFYQSLYQNFSLVIEKTLNSIVIKDPEKKDELIRQVFKDRGLHNRVDNFLNAVSERGTEYLYEGSYIRRLSLSNAMAESYLHQYYLHKLLPLSLESKFNTCVVEYYQTFHSSNKFEDFNSVIAIIHFMKKTYFLMLAVSHVGVYLSLDSREYRKKQLKKVEICCEQYLSLLDGLDEFLRGYFNEAPSDARYDD